MILKAKRTYKGNGKDEHGRRITLTKQEDVTIVAVNISGAFEYIFYVASDGHLYSSEDFDDFTITEIVS